MARALLNDRAIRTWLEERSLDYERPRQGIFHVPIPGTSGRTLRIGLATKVGVAVFMIPLVVRVPMNRLRQAHAYLNQLNTDEPMGAWVINERTGEIIFRAGLPLTATRPEDIWYMLRRVTTRVGGTVEQQWARVLGIELEQEEYLPDWADEEDRS